MSRDWLQDYAPPTLSGVNPHVFEYIISSSGLQLLTRPRSAAPVEIQQNIGRTHVFAFYCEVLYSFGTSHLRL